jgi:hypothetical protein
MSGIMRNEDFEIGEEGVLAVLLRPLDSFCLLLRPLKLDDHSPHGDVYWPVVVRHRVEWGPMLIWPQMFGIAIARCLARQNARLRLAPTNHQGRPGVHVGAARLLEEPTREFHRILEVEQRLCPHGLPGPREIVSQKLAPNNL